MMDTLEKRLEEFAVGSCLHAIESNLKRKKAQVSAVLRTLNFQSHNAPSNLPMNLPDLQGEF